MKRILSILSLMLLIIACDDGNVTVDVIDFTEVPAVKCSDKDLIYKIKDSEMLFLEIPNATFSENETLENAPLRLPINGTNKVTYRKYASTVTGDNICGSAPDVTPNLIEQWKATDGIIQITATAIKATNSTTGIESITGYKYYIELKDVTFDKPGPDQLYTTFPFGNYIKTVTPLPLGFDNLVDKSTCSSSDNRIFNFNASEAFILDIADFDGMFANVETTTPRTALISSSNKLSYRLYSNAITNAYFCTATAPATPTLLQQWDAVDGIEATSGIIEVTTVRFGSDFQHTIHLKKVSLKKGNSSFTLGDDYVFGSFLTTP
ncbi:hypothetical protein [Flavobacterium sp. 25HG05S-40]|uniref:hypothetical protein n=1 Tax=Flavobacterium sp. 25HG05S-40 TaxID=3458682 RepID=UPI0040450669